MAVLLPRNARRRTLPVLFLFEVIVVGFTVVSCEPLFKRGMMETLLALKLLGLDQSVDKAT